MCGRSKRRHNKPRQHNQSLQGPAISWLHFFFHLLCCKGSKTTTWPSWVLLKVKGQTMSDKATSCGFSSSFQMLELPLFEINSQRDIKATFWWLTSANSHTLPTWRFCHWNSAMSLLVAMPAGDNTATEQTAKLKMDSYQNCSKNSLTFFEGLPSDSSLQSDEK